MNGLLGSKEAKQEYFLKAEDLRDLPRETLYFGFASGRASWYYSPKDLHAASIKRHGEAGYLKKVASRKKRLANKKRKQEELERKEEELVKITNKTVKAVNDENVAPGSLTLSPPCAEPLKRQKVEVLEPTD